MTTDQLETILKDKTLYPVLEQKRLTIRNKKTGKVEGKNVHVISNRDLNDISEFVRNWK